MEKIYRVLGKRGRVTIPYEIRQKVGFSQNDVLSLERSEHVKTVIVRRERICDCAKSEPGSTKNEVTLYDFLNSLTPKQQRAALIHLSVKWAETQGESINAEV